MLGSGEKRGKRAWEWEWVALTQRDFVRNSFDFLMESFGDFTRFRCFLWMPVAGSDGPLRKSCRFGEFRAVSPLVSCLFGSTVGCLFEALFSRCVRLQCFCVGVLCFFLSPNSEGENE